MSSAVNYCSPACFLDLKIGIILATGDGEITRIGFQHEHDTGEKPLALTETHKGVAESLAKAEMLKQIMKGLDAEKSNLYGVVAVYGVLGRTRFSYSLK